MKTLHLYLTRETLQTLLMTVAVFTFVLLLGNVLKEIFALLVNQQATLDIVLRAIGLLIPYVLVFALPMGMLAAALLVFGRFSADQELTAVRASGVSLVALVTPILLLSLLVSGLCALLNLEVGPLSRRAYRNLIHDFRMERLTFLLTEDRFIDEIPGCILYVRKVNGSRLQDVHFYQLQDGKVTQRVRASEGLVEIDGPAQKLHLTLTNAVGEMLISQEKSVVEMEISEEPPERAVEEQWFEIDRTGVLRRTLDLAPKQKTERPLKLSEMTFRQLRQEIRLMEERGVETTPALVRLHQQVSFSFASVAFTLIGIPLGIRAHRRETTFGIALSLVLVLVYYSFIIVGEALASRPELMPHLLLWVPNFLFQIVGTVLLWKANGRG